MAQYEKLAQLSPRQGTDINFVEAAKDDIVSLLCQPVSDAVLPVYGEQLELVKDVVLCQGTFVAPLPRWSDAGR